MAAEEAAATTEERVTPLELFFDLVYVFAITQVTQFIADDPTWEGLLRGLLVLAVVWWAWAAYAWLTNTLDPNETRTRIAMFVSMAAMFVAALALPKAFGDHALLFACAYTVVRATHILLYGYAANDTDVKAAVGRLAPPSFIACGLLIAAAFLDGVPQGALWAVAIAIDYAGPVIAGMQGWVLHPSHFVERHGLIVIIAFGESIVATGLSATGVGLDAGVVAAAVLGIVVAAALWWAYFDVVILVAERRLHQQVGVAQVAMARDSYSFIHLLLIVGIVLLALGAKKTIANVDEPLKIVPAVALCGGVAIYLLGHIAFRLRNVGSVNRPRLVTAAVCVALIPLATELDALVTLSALAAIVCLLILYEVIAYKDARARVRQAVHA